MSDSLWPHGLQHTRPPCPSSTPRVYSNSCPLSWWWHPTILSSVVPFSFCLQAFNPFQHQGLFQWVGSSHQVARYWSFNFSISPYSGLISFRIDWFVSLQATRLSRWEPSPAPQFKDINCLVLNLFLLSSFHICTWLLEKPELWQYWPLSESNVSAFEYAV